MLRLMTAISVLIGMIARVLICYKICNGVVINTINPSCLVFDEKSVNHEYPLQKSAAPNNKNAKQL